MHASDHHQQFGLPAAALWPLLIVASALLVIAVCLVGWCVQQHRADTRMARPKPVHRPRAHNVPTVVPAGPVVAPGAPLGRRHRADLIEKHTRPLSPAALRRATTGGR